MRYPFQYETSPREMRTERESPALQSGVPGRLPVACVGAPAPPVRLGRDLILAQPATGEDLAQPQDDRRLAEQVGMAVAGRQLDLGRLGGEQRRITGWPADPVQPADPGPGRGEQLELVVGLRYLQHQRRIGV